MSFFLGPQAQFLSEEIWPEAKVHFLLKLFILGLESHLLLLFCFELDNLIAITSSHALIYTHNPAPNSMESLEDLVPYVILIFNCGIFNLLRELTRRLCLFWGTKGSPQMDKRKASSSSSRTRKHNKGKPINDNKDANPSENLECKVSKVALFLNELLSTCELCAGCAELNVIHERQGSIAYGLTLTLLTYIWSSSFGEAHTSPAYLIEEFTSISSSPTNGHFYSRFAAQLLAIPIGWRFAALYWRHGILSEHKLFLLASSYQCKSSLNTSTSSAFSIELVCSALCRLIELISANLATRGHFNERTCAIATAALSSLLVVLALDHSGGYFNPVLASSLEFGCEGAHWSQHALVFWVAPLLGHPLGRFLFELKSSHHNESPLPANNRVLASEQSNSGSKKKR